MRFHSVGSMLLLVFAPMMATFSSDAVAQPVAQPVAAPPPPDPIVDISGAALGAVAGGVGGFFAFRGAGDVADLYFLSSNRDAIGATGAVVGAVVGSMVGSVWLARRRSAARSSSRVAPDHMDPRNPSGPFVIMRGDAVPLAIGDSVRLVEAPGCGTMYSDAVGEVVALHPDAVVLGFERGTLTLRGDGQMRLGEGRRSVRVRRGDEAFTAGGALVAGVAGAYEALIVNFLPAMLLYIPISISWGTASAQSFMQVMGAISIIHGAFAKPTSGIGSRPAFTPPDVVGTLRFPAADAEGLEPCRWTDKPGPPDSMPQP